MIAVTVRSPRSAHEAAREERRTGGWEYRIVLAAVGVVGLHIVDDNYLQPEPGTSAREHLASGLVPLAVLGLLALLYPRLRPGARAYMSMTLGVLAVMVGVPGVNHLTKGVASGDDFTGLLSVVAGVVLVGMGPVLLWRSRKPGPTRSRAVLRRALLALAAIAIAYVTFWLVFLAIGSPTSTRTSARQRVIRSSGCPRSG